MVLLVLSYYTYPFMSLFLPILVGHSMHPKRRFYGLCLRTCHMMPQMRKGKQHVACNYSPARRDVTCLDFTEPSMTRRDGRCFTANE